MRSRLPALSGEQGPALKIVRDNEDYVVTGQEVERQIIRTNFANEAAVNRLLKDITYHGRG